MLDNFKRERRPGDLVFAVLFVIIALALTAALPAQAKFVQGMKFIAQPAFWPVVGVSMMLGFGSIHIVSSLLSPRTIGRLREVSLWIRSLEYVVWFYVYVITIPVLGYLPSTLIFVVSLCLRLGYRSAAVLSAGAVFSVAVVLVFKAGLGVALPAGEIYNNLPDGIRNFMMRNF